MTFFCIADKDTSLGFKLAGVETEEVSGRRDALVALEVSMAREDVGIILVTEKAGSFIREELGSLIYKSQHPLILEIPSRGEAKKRKSVGEFLKEVIGVGV